MVNGTWGRENLTEVLIQHVRGEVAHYRGRCYAWDVVNEVLNNDGTLRSDLWLETIGPEYIAIAFKEAAKVDPHVKLYYNEYDIEFKGPKHDGALKVVKMIQEAGARIDGIGFQSHFAAETAPDAKEQVQCMKDFTDLGLELAVTELDVRIKVPVDAAGLQQQKKVYADTVEACLQTKRCVGITVWDFWDQVRFLPLSLLCPFHTDRPCHRTRGCHLTTRTIRATPTQTCTLPIGRRSQPMRPSRAC